MPRAKGCGIAGGTHHREKTLPRIKANANKVIYPVRIYRPDKRGVLKLIHDISATKLIKALWSSVTEELGTVRLHETLYGRAGRAMARKVKQEATQKKKPVPDKVDKILNELEVTRGEFW